MSDEDVYGVQGRDQSGGRNSGAAAAAVDGLLAACGTSEPFESWVPAKSAPFELSWPGMFMKAFSEFLSASVWLLPFATAAGVACIAQAAVAMTPLCQQEACSSARVGLDCHCWEWSGLRVGLAQVDMPSQRYRDDQDISSPRSRVWGRATRLGSLSLPSLGIDKRTARHAAASTQAMCTATRWGQAAEPPSRCAWLCRQPAFGDVHALDCLPTLAALQHRRSWLCLPASRVGCTCACLDEAQLQLVIDDRLLRSILTLHCCNRNMRRGGLAGAAPN